MSCDRCPTMHAANVNSTVGSLCHACARDVIADLQVRLEGARNALSNAQGTIKRLTKQLQIARRPPRAKKGL